MCVSLSCYNTITNVQLFHTTHISHTDRTFGVQFSAHTLTHMFIIKWNNNDNSIYNN